MNIGDIIRLKNLDIWPRPPAPGSKAPYQINRMKWNVKKGFVYVAVLLGTESLDGSDAIDVDALILKLAAEIDKAKGGK